MTSEEFMKKVLMECNKRSMMTYSFKDKEYSKFRNWFFRYAKKHMGWNKWKARTEFEQFAKAFKITIK